MMVMNRRQNGKAMYHGDVSVMGYSSGNGCHADAGYTYFELSEKVGE